MKSFTLLGTLLVASLATVFATPRRQGMNRFSLEANRKSSSKPDFVREWVAAHQKWGKPVSQETLAAFSLLDDDGRVDVKPLGSDEIYIADIKVGTPPQTLKIAIDTGSADLPNASKTAHRVRDAEWEVEYVDGSHADGIVYLDTVRLGGFELKNTAIQSAQIIAARFESEPGLTGILGLAKTLPSNVDPPTPSFLDKLSPLLDKAVFTVDLHRNATGRFDFGYIDESRAKDNISWMATREDSPHWDVTFDMTAWTGARRVWMAHTFEATIDTGTTLIFLPPALAGLYWNDVPNMRINPDLGDAFTFPCDFTEELPDLMFKVPNTEHVLKIPGSYLSYSPTDDDPEYCWGGMQSAEDLGGVTIIGDVALKALYVAFDLENNKVGFANKDLDDIDD
ncbi:endothiapepsin [Fusarium langsethiae]|uniref:Endothiapepsin n=1 Tax=Fusarium langsethiae TaxID=179993 RepID=A0A0M9F2E0_FUSLA|nr:endothiapepsin [Fusarium langsethiae]